MQHIWQFLKKPGLTPDPVKAIEQIINQALSDSQQAQQPLARLEQQMLAISIVPPELTLFVSVRSGRVQLLRSTSDKANLHITGSPIALTKLALARDKQSVIENEELHIEGATSALHAWQQLFRSLDIDWEYQLAQRIGKIPARLIIVPARALKKQAQTSLEQVHNNLGHVLVWNNLAVDSAELDEFASESHDLRARIEKLRKRTEQLDRT